MIKNITKENIIDNLPSYNKLHENEVCFNQLVDRLSKSFEGTHEFEYFCDELNKNVTEKKKIEQELDEELNILLSNMLHSLSDYSNIAKDDAFAMYCKDMNDLRAYFANDIIDSDLFELMSCVLYDSYKSNKYYKDNGFSRKRK